MSSVVVATEDLGTPEYTFEGAANTWGDWRKLTHLVNHLTWRHLAARYRGSSLGFLWSLLNPILLMGTYTFVFRFIFRATAPDVPYPCFLLTGILAWNFVNVATMNAAFSLVDGATLFKKTSFPHIVLPISAVLANAINYLMALPLLIVFNLLFGIVPTMSLLWFPVALLLLLGMALGLGMILAVLMPFFRDLQHLVEALFTVWFFITPVLYPVTLVQQNLPEPLLFFYEFNPMVGVTHLIHTTFLGQPLPGMSLAISVGGIGALYGFGLWLFKRLAIYCAEV